MSKTQGQTSQGPASIVSAKTFVAQLLANGLNVNSLRSNALLRKEEWVELDTTVVEIARQRLVGIADLQSRGLTLPLGGLGTLVSQYEAQSDMTPAQVDMSGVTPGEEDNVTFDLRSVPIPIIHKDFRINIRRLEASRRLGDSIDTTQAAVATRRVVDGNENMLFKGVGVTVDGNKIYGYTTHPNRNLGDLQVWNFANIGNIYDDILGMVAKAHAAHYYGPYILYVSSNRWPALMLVHDDGSGQTALARAKNIPGIEDIKVSDALVDDNAVLVQMTKDVVDLAVAQDITTVQWDSLGGMMVHFKVMNALAPRIKSDHDGRCGIVHYSYSEPEEPEE